MILSDAGQSRVRGYLFVPDRSPQSPLPKNVTRDAVREIESHINARAADTDARGDERAAVERILTELGSPLRVAQAYSADRTLDDSRRSTNLRVLSSIRRGSIGRRRIYSCPRLIAVSGGFATA